MRISGFLHPLPAILEIVIVLIKVSYYEEKLHKVHPVKNLCCSEQTQAKKLFGTCLLQA